MKKYLVILSTLISSLIFSQTGNVGIGTVTPTASLHVKTSNEYIIRLEDNVNSDFGNYVIVSNDTNGTFKKQATNAFKTAYTVPLPATGVDITTQSPTWQTTNTTIQIPNGRWSVVVNLLLKCKENIASKTNTAIIVKATLADSGSLTPTNDIEGNSLGSTTGTGVYEGVFNMPVNKGLIAGSIVINNTGNVKTYQLIANKNYFGTNESCTISNLGSNTDPQNIIYVLPLNQ